MDSFSKAMVTLAILVGSVGAGMADEAGELTLADVQRLIEERGYSWNAGHTGVSDLPGAARRGLAGLVLPPDADQLEAEVPLLTVPPGVELPDRWDWRESVPGIHPVGVTPVKDQGTCGSCWAFAAAAQLESHILITDGVVEDLSEQQLVSCNHNGGSCAGGWHLNAYTVFMTPGAVTESCFPYENANVPCGHWDCPAVARIADYSRVANDMRSIKYALTTGPLFVGIRWQEMFPFYQRGVFDVPLNDPLDDPPVLPIGNHAVLLVGWDDTLEHGLGTGAWIIKNSWGSEWGMEGYAYIAYTSTFLEVGPRQLIYLPDSSSHLVLDEPQTGQTWIAGTNQTISWITDLAADRFEVGYLIGGQYQVMDDAVPGTNTHFEFNAPETRAEDLVVRVTALTSSGAALATAESTEPIFLVNQRVEWPADGVAVQTGDGPQRPHDLVADGAGGCILVWRDLGGNYVTRLSAQGEQVWAGSRSLPGSIASFAVVGDDAGGAFLAYSMAMGGNSALFLIRVTPDGSLPWGTMGVRVDHLGGEFSMGHSVNPLLASDGNGGVICTWTFYSASFETVCGQRITADGVKLWDAGGAPGLRLTERAGAGPCALTRLVGGAVAVAYVSYGDGSFDRTDLWVQLVHDTGELPWGEAGRRVRAGAGPTEDHSLAADLTGGFAIVWRESGTGWSWALLQRFAADGVPVWNDGGLLVDQQVVAGRLRPRLIADEAGGHLVSIAKESSLAEFEVSLHRFGPDGARVWQPAGVSLVEKVGLIGYLGVDAPLVADGVGGAIVFWADLDAAVSGGQEGLTAQHVAADGTLEWTPYGEPVVLSHDVPACYPAVCRDRTGNVSLAWGYTFASPSVNFQRIAGTFPAPPRCEITAWLQRDGELQPLAGNVVRGCPDGDADAVVIVCDFDDADMEGMAVVAPDDIGLDTSGLGISLGSATAADLAGNPDNGYRVTLVRDRVLGCSGCDGEDCDDVAVAAGPLPVTYQGLTVGTVADVAVHGLDVTGDGAVNLAEIVGLVGTYLCELGDPAFDGCYDTTGDELVDVADWSLLVEHYGVTADPAPAGILSLRRLDETGGAVGSQVYEVIVAGAGVEAAALRLEARGAPASTLEWHADSPAASGALLLPVPQASETAMWLVLPQLGGTAGPGISLGRLVLSGPALPAGAPDALRVVGGELMLGDGSILALVGGSTHVAVAGATALAPPFPNPCNPATTITFTAPRTGRLSLRIYDVTGRLVRTLIDESARGSNEPRHIAWVGRDEADREVASGMYFVRLVAGAEVATRRLMLIR